MPRKLDKKSVQAIIDYLKDKPKMPHNVAVIELSKRGVNVSINSVSKIRKRYELEFFVDTSTHKMVLDVYNKGAEITKELLAEKFPHICEEHANYLIDYYANKRRKINQTSAMKVRETEYGKLIEFGNVKAHVAYNDGYAFFDGYEVEPVRVNTFDHAVQQLTLKCA